MSSRQAKNRRFNMSRQAYVHKGSLLEGKEQSTVQERFPILVIGLTALVLVALAVLAVMQMSKPGTLPWEGDSRFAANPELMAARRYASPATAESSLLAANPELMAARRYTAPAGAESSFIAANPELMAARRYQGP
jgi:hypothetical protein